MLSRHLRATFAALQVREFAILWAGSLFAITAFFMSTIVNAIVAFDLTGKSGAVGLAMMGQGLAMFILGPVGGAFADRLSKRLIISICHSVNGAVFLVMGVLTATGEIEVIYLAMGAFVIGTMFAFMGPANQAWIVELVGPERRGNAVALNQVSMNASRIVGPALAGVLAGWAVFGPEGAYFVMAALLGCVVLSLTLLPPSRPAEQRDTSVLGDLRDGFAYIGGHPRIRAMLILFAVVIIFGLSYVTILPALVENHLGRPASAFGTLQAVGAAGGLIASLVVAPMADSRRAVIVYASAGLVFGLSVILTGLSPSFAIAFIPMFIVGIGSGAFQTLNMAVVVTSADTRFYGRIMSVMMLAFSGFMLVALPLGLLADAIGERVTLGLMGGVVSAAVLIMTPIILRAPSPATEGPGPAAAERAAPAAGGR